MLKKLILFIFAISWGSSTYAFNIKKTKVHLSGHVGFSNPYMQLLDKDLTKITKNTLWGGTLSIQPFKYTSIDIEGSCFWPSYSTPSSDVKNAENEYIFTSTTHYMSRFFDLTLKTALYRLFPSANVYVKYGLWGLATRSILHTEYKSTPATPSTQRKEIEPEYSRAWGYGVAIGPGINWIFAPRSFRTLSLDCALLACIPTPSLSMLGKNYVSGIFPVARVGVNWHAW
jgi:hypothetical protein